MSRILVTGRKETFLIKILIKKLRDAGMDAEFVPWNVDAINSGWEGTSLVTLYMEDGERPDDGVLHFLIDRMVDGKVHMLSVGGKSDTGFIQSHVPDGLVLRSFLRPVDNAEFVKAVAELLNKEAAGEFKKSILIVDDDPNYLGLVREWLKGFYKIAMANSGAQALGWLAKNTADLILLDYEMPITSGPQVLEMLRSEDETKRIPVIFLTGKSDRESVMAVMSLKPEGYFLKSIEREELLKRLEEYFALHP